MREKGHPGWGCLFSLDNGSIHQGRKGRIHWAEPITAGSPFDQLRLLPYAEDHRYRTCFIAGEGSKSELAAAGAFNTASIQTAR